MIAPERKKKNPRGNTSVSNLSHQAENATLHNLTLSAHKVASARCKYVKGQGARENGNQDCSADSEMGWKNKRVH